MELVFENLFNLELQQVIMWLIGGILIYLAIKKTWNLLYYYPLVLVPYWLICLFRSCNPGY